MRRVLIYLVCFWIPYISIGQQVLVSNEINIKNNYAYDILPNVGDHTIFYHDKGYDHSFDVYDNLMRYKSTTSIEFEKKNILPVAILPKDSTFNFYYSYRMDGNTIIKVRRYDMWVKQLDTVTILKTPTLSGEGACRFTMSKDKSKIILFTPLGKNLNIILVDNNTFETIDNYTLLIDNFDFKSDFEKILLTNDGSVFISGRKASFWNIAPEESQTIIWARSGKSISIHKFTPDQFGIASFAIDYDEINKKLVIGGLTSQNNDDSVNGYFGFTIAPELMPADAEIITNLFSLEFLAEVYGKKIGKVKSLTFFKLQNIRIRHDGGCVLLLESVKEFARRSQMNTIGPFGDMIPSRGYIDYYHEDILAIATYPDGKEHWKKVLFKKQFSQDDDGVFSSYFLFITPSRIKLIFNDEIKNNNTVSEYVLDPLGSVERKSVLSTDYQGLKLRFRSAVQTGPSSVIVPSEKNGKLSLVKIDY